jgi:hypothetical protein
MSGIRELSPPDWLWFGEDEAGRQHISFGRWQNHPSQRRYKLADIQPTEHDHPVPIVSQDWPFGCPKQRSCSRHRACMYGCKANAGRPPEVLRRQIDAALADATSNPHPTGEKEGRS